MGWERCEDVRIGELGNWGIGELGNWGIGELLGFDDCRWCRVVVNCGVLYCDTY
jgi:hypothetical protein